MDFVSILVDNLFIGAGNSPQQLFRERAAEHSANVLKKIVQSINHNHLNDKLILEIDRLFAATFGCFSTAESRPNYFHKQSFLNVLELFTDLVVMTFGGFREISEQILEKTKRLLLEHIAVAKSFLKNPPFDIYYLPSSMPVPSSLSVDDGEIKNSAQVSVSNVLTEQKNESKKCFGEVRKAVINFVAGLLNSGDEEIENCLVELEVFESIMDLFFQFANSNIAGSTIMQMIIVPVFEDDISNIKNVLLDKYNLLEKVVQHYKDPLTSEWTSVACNNGYLTKIAMLFIDLGIGENDSKWDEFIVGKLKNVIELESRKEKLPERTQNVDKNGKLNISKLMVDVENTSIKFG